MNIEEVREYCLSLKNTIECFPFDEVSLVFNVVRIMWKSYGNIIRRLSQLTILIRNTGIAFIWTGIWKTRRLNAGSSILTGK